MYRIVLLALGLAGALAAQECETRFAVALGDPKAPEYGVTSENMREWWAEKGQDKHKSLCYVDTAAEADYVVFWKVLQGTRVIQLPDSERTTTSGSIGNRPVSINSTTTGSRDATQVLTTVAVGVFAGEELVYQTSKTGKFRWSKPDENALEEALEQMDKGFKDLSPKNQTGLAKRPWPARSLAFGLVALDGGFGYLPIAARFAAFEDAPLQQLEDR